MEKFICPEGVSVIDFMNMPDEWVPKQVYDGVKSDYATLAAAAKRMWEAVDYCDDSSGVTEVRFNDAAQFKAALAEVEALLKEGECG